MTALERCRDAVAGLGPALAAARGGDDLAAVLASVTAAVEGELGRAAPRPPLACRAGCAACCTVQVGTLALEGAAAAAWLRRRRPAEEAAALGAALLRFQDEVRWVDDAERIVRRLACPLLDGAGGCAIYPVRPLACRGMNSADAGACRAALAERVEEGDDAGAGAVAMDVLQKALYEEAASALAGLTRSMGWDARRRDVSGMTGLFLARPELVGALLQGAPLPIE